MIRPGLTIFLGGLLFSVIAAPARTEVLSDTDRAIRLDAALKAFDRGASLRSRDPAGAAESLKEAQRLYEEVIQSGIENGKLYYNLANTQVLLGDLGQAIANYRRAQRLIPGDGNLAENLRYARSLCRTRIELEGSRAALGTLFFWHNQTSQIRRFQWGLAAYLAFWVLVLLRIAAPRFKWAYAGVPLLVIWVTLAASVTAGEVLSRTSRDGVLLRDDVILRKGDGESYDPQFKEPIHSGVEVRILEDRRDWYRVQLNDAKEGWVPSDSIEII